MTRPFRLDEARFAEGLAHLAQVDPEIAAALERFGPPAMRVQEEGFTAILRAILGQQVSVHAARAIRERLEKAVGEMTPANVLRLSEEEMRACGLSRPKIAYIRSLAQLIVDGRLDFEALRAMDDEDVIQALVQVKGVGRWTAEMYLMFALGRPDVMAPLDIGLLAGAHQLKQLKRRPDGKRLMKLAEAWRPLGPGAAGVLWPVPHSIPQLLFRGAEK